jgi:hypothetical protein
MIIEETRMARLRSIIKLAEKNKIMKKNGFVAE